MTAPKGARRRTGLRSEGARNERLSDEGRRRVQRPRRRKASAETRAGSLLRWYPGEWRERYGAEFTELLIPAAELAWMVVSPAALAGLATGLARLVRRLDLPPRLLRYQARLGQLAAAGMAVFLAAAASWVLAGQHAAGPLFRPGAIDVAALAAMTLALAVGWQALRRTALH